MKKVHTTVEFRICIGFITDQDPGTQTIADPDPDLDHDLPVTWIRITVL
jgi:hypothetical protein